MLRRWSVEGLVLALLLPTYAYFYQSAEHNEAARFDQIRSILDDGVLHVDRWAWNTADLIAIERGGERHVYPNKAPGATLLALPSAALWRWVLDAREESARWHVVAWLTTLSTVGLLSALAAVATCRLLTRVTRRPGVAAAATLAVWLATPLFPFSTLLFSHALAAALLALAACTLAGGGRRGGARLARHGAAGLALGLAAITEYPTVLLGSLIALWALLRLWRQRGGWPAAAALVGGGLLGLLPLLAYNQAVFGEPFAVAYAVYAQQDDPRFPVYTRGAFGLAWPGTAGYLRALSALSVGERIGLLHLRVEDAWVYACSPVLLLALPGLATLLWRRGERLTGGILAAACLTYVTFNACYGSGPYDWGGGGVFGPRHLVPLIPLLAVPVALGLRRWPRAFAALALPSAFYMLIGTAVQPRVPTAVPSAARDFHLPLYLEGRFALSGGELFDVERRPLVAGSMAWNVAGVLGVPGPWQLAPLLGWWLVVGLALLARTRRGRCSPWRLPLVPAATLVTFTLAAAAGPVLAGVLATPGDAGAGLMGSWHRGSGWTGPATRRVDPEIAFDWSGSGQPAFSVEWTGSIRIARRGRYWFTLISDDGSRLWIDERLVVDNAGAHPPQERTGHVALEPGRHRIRVRYFNGVGSGVMQLRWVPPGLPPEVVPTHVLFPE